MSCRDEENKERRWDIETSFMLTDSYVVYISSLNHFHYITYFLR